MAELTVSPLDSIRRRDYLSPQASHRSTTEPNAFEKSSYSPISQNKSNNSYIQASQQRTGLTNNLGAHKDIDTYRARHDLYVEPPYSFQPKFTNLTNRPSKSPRERTFPTEPEQQNGYRYLKPPEIHNYQDLNHSKKAEERSRTPREEAGSGLYRTLKDKSDIFRQHEDTATMQRGQRINLKEPTFFNLTKSGVSLPYGDLLSPGTRTATPTLSAGTNSKAYAKAMKALQERVAMLEGQIKTLEKGKTEAEREKEEERMRGAELERRLEEAKKSVDALKELEKEKKVWEEKEEKHLKEREAWKKEKEEVAKEKELLMQEKEKTIKEKDEWVNGKEVFNRKLFEMEKEKEETERRNKILDESLKKLEKEHMEYKKVYHQHLEGVIVKNESLVVEIAQIKEYYDNQIKDFEKELSSIEESHARKVENYELTIEDLSKQCRDFEDLFKMKQKEFNSLRAQLDNLESIMGSKRVQELRYFEDRGTPSRKIEAINLPSAEKAEADRSRITYPSERSTEQPVRYSEKPDRKGDYRFDLRGQNRSPMSTNVIEEETEAEIPKSAKARMMGDTPVQAFEELEGEVNAAAAASVRKSSLEKNEDKHDKAGRGGRAVGVAAGKGDSRQDIEDRREAINRNLKEEMSQMSGYEKNARSYGEQNQGLKLSELHPGFNHYADAAIIWNEQVETAHFPKQTFGAEMLGASKGSGREVRDASSPKTFVPLREHPISTFKVFGAVKSPESQRIKEKIAEKEKELGQANDQYQALLKKIQENQNSLERSKMRSDLIELTDEIQKINDHIYQLKKQESYV